MTNAIEQAKREMYTKLAGFKMLVVPLEVVEDSLESYLELLRQDHEALHETARKRFEDLQVAEAANQELVERLSLMTTDRDSLRNRMQAYEARESRAPEIAQEATYPSKADTDSGKDKIAACMGAIERWSDIQAAADRGALLDIIKILSGGKD